jgi:hypothetical protein
MGSSSFRLVLLALCFAAASLYLLQQSLVHSSHGASAWSVHQLLGMHPPPREVSCGP